MNSKPHMLHVLAQLARACNRSPTRMPYTLIRTTCQQRSKRELALNLTVRRMIHLLQTADADASGNFENAARYHFNRKDSVLSINCSSSYNLRSLVVTRESIWHLCGYGATAADRHLDDQVS